MSTKSEESTIAKIKEGFNALFDTSIESIDLEKEEDDETFLFEIQFAGNIQELNIPEGLIVTFISFNERLIEGFLDSVSFLQFVDDNS